MPGSIEYNGIRWKKYQRVLVPDEAADREIALGREEARELMEKACTSMVRSTSHFDDPQEPCFWYVIKDSDPSMEALSSNTRSKIRRGNKRCCVEKASKEEIAEEGYQAYYRAFQRYENFRRPLSRSDFARNIHSLDGDHWDLWKVADRDSGDIVAYSRNRTFGHSCNYTEIKFDPSALKDYPSYILFQRMNEHYLSDRGYRFVNDGARSISHETGVQDFLIKKFGFRKAYCRLHVHYRPWLKGVVRMSYPFRRLLKRGKGSRIQQLNALLSQEEIIKCQTHR